MIRDTSVKVAVRVRPQNERERSQMQEICTSVMIDNSQIFLGKDKCFTFDHVFDMSCDQELLYQTLAKPLVEGCLEGYNATLFAYGQTGSGKTYTMGTAGDSNGIVPRAVQHLFDLISQSRELATEKGTTPTEFKVMAQFLELYNEELIDLLDILECNGSKVSKSHVRIHEDAKGDIYVTGATTRIVYSAEDAMQCLRDGANVRSTGSTLMNAQSSRSHAIFTLFVKQHREDVLSQNTNVEEREDDSMDSTAVVKGFRTLNAKFHFIDLAGSERLKRTGATGDRAKEGIAINCGLLALGNVISALGTSSVGKPPKRNIHIPYRDSKLTRLLQDSLGGNSRTIMIACVSPSDCDFLETLTTLQYANRAKNIKNKVTVNQDSSSKQIAFLRAHIAQLEAELAEFKKPRLMPNNANQEEVAEFQQDSRDLRERLQLSQVTAEGLLKRNIHLRALLEAADFLKTAHECGDRLEVDVGTVLEEVGVEKRVAELIQKYSAQLEELKSRLIVSEVEVSLLRSSKGRKLTFSNALEKPQPSLSKVASVPAEMGLGKRANQFGEPSADETEKLQLSSGVGDVSETGNEAAGVDDEDDSSSEDEVVNTETLILESLANLDVEIDERQRLLHELLVKTQQLEALRQHYEAEIHRLQARIQATEEERDRVLSSCSSASVSEEEKKKQQQLQRQYEEKLSSMRMELNRLTQSNRENMSHQRDLTRLEAERNRLTNELEDFKRRKVEMARKLREEAKRYREVELMRTREIALLNKKQRHAEHQLRSMQEDREKREVVVKQLQREMESLRRRQVTRGVLPSNPRPMTAPTTHSTSCCSTCNKSHPSGSGSIPEVGFSCGTITQSVKSSLSGSRPLGTSQRPVSVAGSSSSSHALPPVHSRSTSTFTASCKLRRRQSTLAKIFKSRWDEIKTAMENVVRRRHMQTRYNTDLTHWARERHKLALRIATLEKKTGEEEAANPRQLQRLSDLRAQMETLQEQIHECQENILLLGEESQADGQMAAMLAQCSLEEARYIVNHLFEEAVQKAVLLEQKAHTEDALRQQVAKKVKEHEQALVMLKYAVSRPESAQSEVAELLANSGSQRATVRSHDALGQDDDQDEDDEDDCTSCSAEMDKTWTFIENARPENTCHNTTSYSMNRKMRRMSTTTNELQSRMLGSSAHTRLPLAALDEVLDCGEEEEEFQSSSSALTTPVMPPVPMPSSGPSNRPPTSVRPLHPPSPQLAQVRSPLKSTGIAVGSHTDSRLPLRTTVQNVRVLKGQSPQNSRWPMSPRSASEKPHLGHLVRCEHTHNRTTPSTPLECTFVVEGHTSSVLHVSLTSDVLVTGAKDGHVKLWDMRALCERPGPPRQAHSVTKVHWSPATQLCFTATSSFVNVWDARDFRRPVKTLLTTGLADMTVNAYVGNSKASEHNIQSSSASSGMIPPVGLSSLVDTSVVDFTVEATRAENLVMASATAVRYWDLRRFEAVAKLHMPITHSVAMLAGDVRGEESTSHCLGIVAVTRDQKMHYFSIDTRKVLGMIHPTMEFTSPSMSPISPLSGISLHGNTLVTGSRDSTLCRWQLGSSSAMLLSEVQTAHQDPLRCVTLTSNGVNMLSACDRGLLKLWSVDNCVCLGEVMAHSSEGINAVATCGDVVATAGNDGIVKLWRMWTVSQEEEAQYQ